MLFHPLCYLKRALLRLENHPKFSKNFHCGQRYQLKDAKLNALDISDFRNQVHDRMFLGSGWQINLFAAVKASLVVLLSWYQFSGNKLL